MRPWHETYPRRFWSLEDKRAARRAGVMPPAPQPDLDPALRLLNEQRGPVEVALSLYGDRGKLVDTGRRRKVDSLLKAHGIQPRRQAR